MLLRSALLLAFVVAGNGLGLAQLVLRTGNPAVNSASYRIPGSSGSGIAQGSIFSIFGTGLGPSQWLTANTYPLPTTLGGASGTSVTVTVGGVSTQALVVFAYSTQVNAILPSTTPVGNGTITVTYNGQTSAPGPIQVVAGAFGIYTFDSSGWGQAIATNAAGGINTIIQTFHPGDTAVLWGTGLGAIAASDAASPPVGNLPGDIRVRVGSSVANVSYHGRSGCCSGLDQINFEIPSGVQGCHVPVAVETGGTLSNITTIAVSASGQTCSDSLMGQDLIAKLASGQNVSFAHIRLENSNSPFAPGQPYRATSEYGFATFSTYTPQTAGRAEYGVSSGYCIAVDCSNGCGAVKGYSGTLADSSPAQLDAGPSLALSGQGTIQIPQASGGYYASVLNATSPRFLYSGLNYTVSGGPGKDVGAFSAADLTSPRNVEFTNVAAGQNVSRSGDLTVNWTGADPKMQNGQVTIGGYSITDANYTNVSMFQCTAPASANSFTIPGWILSTLPRSGSGQSGTVTYPLGWIWIGQFNTPVAFHTQGIDLGILTDVFFSGVGVYFQ